MGRRERQRGGVEGDTAAERKGNLGRRESFYKERKEVDREGGRNGQINAWRGGSGGGGHGNSR